MTKMTKISEQTDNGSSVSFSAPGADVSSLRIPMGQVLATHQTSFEILCDMKMTPGYYMILHHTSLPYFVLNAVWRIMSGEM